MCMVTQITKDIFDAPIDILVQSCNCFNTFGGGIARFIRDEYPEAYEADCKTKKGDRSKLGTYSSCRTKSHPERRIQFIVNLYGQYNMSTKQRETSYDALADGLTKLRDNLIEKQMDHLTVGVPWKLGSGLGGGDFRIVEAIIRSVFEDTSIKVLICQRPEDVEQK